MHDMPETRSQIGRCGRPRKRVPPTVPKVATSQGLGKKAALTKNS